MTIAQRRVTEAGLAEARGFLRTARAHRDGCGSDEDAAAIDDTIEQRQRVCDELVLLLSRA